MLAVPDHSLKSASPGATLPPVASRVEPFEVDRMTPTAASLVKGVRADGRLPTLGCKAGTHDPVLVIPA
jgi:hypothetical protein